MDEKWLKRTCRKWQRKLGLMDWAIDISFTPVAELDEGSGANISWLPDEMTAQIWVGNPSELEDGSPHFIEGCTVHELLHLLYYGHLPVPEYEVNMERAINKTTRALMPKRKD